MDIGINRALLNICIIAVALCLFKMIIPENFAKKQVDFLVSCFFLASIAFLLTGAGINFDYDTAFSFKETAYADFDESYTKAREQALQKELSYTLKTILEKERIFPEEILISVNISDKYSISINEIRLVFVAEELMATNTDVSEIAEVGDISEVAETPEQLETLKQAIHIVQKEVGGNILVTGEFINGR